MRVDQARQHRHVAEIFHSAAGVRADVDNRVAADGDDTACERRPADWKDPGGSVADHWSADLRGPSYEAGVEARSFFSLALRAAY